MGKIVVQVGAQTKLAKEFGVSRITVWAALTGRTNNERANRIRRAAFLRYYGYELPDHSKTKRI